MWLAARVFSFANCIIYRYLRKYFYAHRPEHGCSARGHGRYTSDLRSESGTLELRWKSWNLINVNLRVYVCVCRGGLCVCSGRDALLRGSERRDAKSVSLGGMRCDRRICTVRSCSSSSSRSSHDARDERTLSSEQKITTVILFLSLPLAHFPISLFTFFFLHKHTHTQGMLFVLLILQLHYVRRRYPLIITTIPHRHVIIILYKAKPQKP